MRTTILTLVMAFCMVIASASAEKPELYFDNTAVSELFNPNSFCKAIMDGDLETVKKMIDMGEDVNKKSLGMTPLHFAARYNRPEIAKILLEHGANVKKRCNKGYTVKKYAELSQATEVLEVLKAAK